MNSTLSCLTLALVLLSSEANAQAPTNNPQDSARNPQGAGATQALDPSAALDALSAKLSSGKLDPSDFEKLKMAIQQRPEAGAPDPQVRIVTARLQRAIDGLEARSEKGALKAQHIDGLREQLLDEKIDRALDQLASTSSPADSSALAFDSISTLVERRAEASRSFDPNADEMRTKVLRELKALKQQAQSKPLPPEALGSFRALLADLRLEHAIGVAESRATASDLTSVELARVRGILEDHAARAPSDVEFQRVREQLDSKLDELESMLKGGSIDATEIAKLRAPLRSTREASTPRGETPKKP